MPVNSKFIERTLVGPGFLNLLKGVAWGNVFALSQAVGPFLLEDFRAVERVESGEKEGKGRRGLKSPRAGGFSGADERRGPSRQNKFGRRLAKGSASLAILYPRSRPRRGCFGDGMQAQ